MGIRKIVLLSILTCFFNLSFPSMAEAQYATCVVRTKAYNQNRRVLAPTQGVRILEECSWPHTVPFGRWGVSSNVGTKISGKQFEGWHGNDPGNQWNSCTGLEYLPGVFFYAPPDCNFYNDEGCTKQITEFGINGYGGVGTPNTVSCPRENWDGTGLTWIGGCTDINTNATLTLSNNYMTLYEMDWPDEDDVVQTLYFPDRSATLQNCDAWGCPPNPSPWAGPTRYNTPVSPPLVDAQMRITVSAELFTDGSYGDCDDWYCPPCGIFFGCEPCERLSCPEPLPGEPAEPCEIS